MFFTKYISKRLFSLCCIAIACFSLAIADDFIVVIDAGHGGKDIGAADNNVKEKDINLGVALQLGEMIKKKMKKVKVVYTRDKDNFLTLQQRADKANKAKGDIFISIHTNSVDVSNKNRTTVAGASTYVLGLHKDKNNQDVARRENSVIALESNYEKNYQGFDPNSDESNIIFELAQKENLQQSIKLANEVQKQLVKVADRKDRGVHQAGFWVLWATSMPSILIELDFICNPNSAKYIASSSGQKKLAEGIFNAIKSYYEALKSKGTNALSIERNESTENNATADAILATATPGHKSVQALPQPNKHQSSSSSTQRRRRSDASREISANRQIDKAVITADNNVNAKSNVTSTTESDAINKEQNNVEIVKTNISKNSRHEEPQKSKIVQDKKNKSEEGLNNAVRLDKKKTVYKIQIFESSEHLKTNNPCFCGLTPISCIKEKDLYKYTYGESEDKKEIDKMLKDVKRKIPNAFVIKIRKGVKK